jgi:hypothetical protein
MTGHGAAPGWRLDGRVVGLVAASVGAAVYMGSFVGGGPPFWRPSTTLLTLRP